MLMSQRAFPVVIFLWSLSMTSICRCANLNHLKWKSKEHEPKKCYMDSCGPPFSYQFIPNPPRLDTECTILVDFEVAHDYFKGYFSYNIQGPGTLHFRDKVDATPPRPYLQGEHFHRNFTYLLPEFIPAGIPFHGNFTLINDIDQLLICGTVFCEFAPN
ncbi:hypothetical protein HOLleu_19354 [Holothuria leucospilota]|uniref:CUB domain-containing protein n=1 Tax=Holothuria leucospilota TaxID=206669 RepID=A0A9Q1BZG3_HOLLE|nr:hypothetical protein HOLleu_19354 [Holothuria leucospilota]